MVQVDFAAMRGAMVASQLRTSDVNDSAVIAAMLETPREDFVPADRRETAYVDRAIPLGNGRAINPPLVTGRILTNAEVKPGDKVLLLNDVSGYVAAILHAMGAVVTSVSSAARPAQVAADVNWVEAAAGEGHAAGAPYDAIIVDGAIEAVSEGLKNQLAENGRIVTGLVERGVTRIVSGRKVAGTIAFVSLFDMDIVPAVGFEAAPKEFVF